MRWAAVQLRHLAALRAVADEGSLAGAARRLGYTQPAVSHQLTALERLLETQLVDRRPGARRSTLTEAGRLVLGHGVAILARARAADDDLRRLKAAAAAPGAGPSAG